MLVTAGICLSPETVLQKKYNIIIKSRGSSYSFPINPSALRFCICVSFAINLRHGKFEVYRSVTE